MVTLARTFIVRPSDLSTSESKDAEATAAAERCRQDIAAIEALILAGHPDVEGLCMALADWSAELRIIEQEVCRQ